MIKMVASHYIHNGSKVLGCFLDASKAFDRVDHGLLFQKLEKRGLPPPIINFLLSWYRKQTVRVQWSYNCLSSSFSISNGVRQGGVLSPYLFAVYLDSLLDELSFAGVGRSLFAGAFCYADDVVLLAPCASALRKMLSICSSYANSHGLSFNAEKTQLICFSKSPHQDRKDVIYFNDVELIFSDHVLHLGHLLSSDLNESTKVQNPRRNSCIEQQVPRTVYILRMRVRVPRWALACISLVSRRLHQ